VRRAGHPRNRALRLVAHDIRLSSVQTVPILYRFGMIKRLFMRVIESITVTETADPIAADRETALRLATAVLMVDVARSDHVFEDDEFDRMLLLIEKHFRLTPQQAAELIDQAEQTAEELVSVYEFTKILHKDLNEDEKAEIVRLLWQIAYADGRLDKYEDSLIRKISDLLHVSRGRSMRLKHDARRWNKWE